MNEQTMKRHEKMDRQEIKEIAAIRDQKVTLVEVNGKGSWFLLDSLPCSIEKVAQCLSSDDYMHWECGELLTFDHNGRMMLPTEKGYWNDLQPIRFFRRPKKAKTMCGRCGFALNLWFFGWKHAKGGRSKRPCCKEPVPVRVGSKS